ncbi:MAG: hypothetical protein HUJ29_13200 [Gammaproteobacteria bacterium]|nr:hypothetical protein [Gammaproteobacteria bacterium]
MGISKSICVIQRGHSRNTVFFEPIDYSAYLERLKVPGKFGGPVSYKRVNVVYPQIEEDGGKMNNETITVRVTESGQTMDVVVYSKRPDRIEVVIGEGVHSVKCELTPTRQGLSYAGSVMGREIIYERSRDDVAAEINKLQQARENVHKRGV